MGTKSTKPSSAALTVDAIKGIILARGLLPGDPLPTEAELVEEIGVSRSSVREAIRTLTALDIVDVQHGTGTFVGDMSMRPFVEAMVFRGTLLPGTNNEVLRQVVEVRRGLDLSMAEHVVGAIPPATAERLTAYVEQMRDASSRGEEFAAADRAFHMELAQSVHNELYPKLVAAFWDIHTHMAPKRGAEYPLELVKTAIAHGEVLAAALDGDLPRYREAIVTHYRYILAAISENSTS